MAELTEALNEIEKLLPSKTHIKDQIKNSEPKILALVIKSYNLLPNNVSSAHSIIDVILDKTWEDLNTGHWSSVPAFRRYIYSVASLMMVLAKIKLSLELTNQERICKLSEALKAADHGLLLGGELRNELTKTAEILTLQLSKCNSKKIFDNILEPSSSLPEFCGIRGDLIPVLSCPSLETFYSDYFKPRKPVVLKDCINHWPALSKWKDINYLLTKAGERTVPVELGSKYDDSEWSQKLMNFRQFVEQHILVTKNKNETGYLAQHQLFLQIPELKEDIREPEFCCCSDLKETNLNEENEDVDINAWFGPAGTVSPLHFDPKHNLLTQIVGRKRIILYDPKYSDRLRPYETKLLNNTAQVDPESPDYNKFSGYKDTPALETILNPGEMLYIPPTWWHHVRSLDISFSVSFWW